MKIFLPFLLCVIISSSSQSQVVFCPPGAEWTYLFGKIYGAPGHTINEKIKYERDSIVENDTVKILSHSQFFLFCSHVTQTLIKQKGDTVFFRNIRTQNTWQILYNFAASAGDTWQTTVLQGQFIQGAVSVTFSYTVDSVYTVFENGFPLRQLIVKPGGMQGVQTITERLGSSAFLFNYMNSGHGFCHGPWFIQKLCYRDSAFPVLQFSDKSCDYFTHTLGITREENTDALFKLFPNPVQDVLNIETGFAEEVTLCFTDLYGREVKKVKINTGEKIDVGDLSRGIYLITISRNKEVLYKTKLMKED